MNDALTSMDWANFHFLRPQLLWLLLPAAIALVLALIGLRERVKWASVIAPALRPFMIAKGSERFKRWVHLLLFLLISLAIAGAAGPTWRQNQLPEQILETPLVIALDLSQSMMAKDLKPNRLERAKFKLIDLLEAKPGANTALIGFAGTAHVIIPLTRDYKIIKSHVQSLSPATMPFPGSDLGAALNLADSLCNGTQAPGTVLLLTDDVSASSFDLLQGLSIASKNKFVLMPFSTPAGAEIPQGKGNRYFKDQKGAPVISALDGDLLKKMESLEGVEVSRLTLDKSDVEKLAEEISANLEFTEDQEQQEDNWKDEGLWLSLPFALLVLVWFRKGWVIYSLLILMSMSSCGQKSNFADLWYSPDYQGQMEESQGHFEAAAQRYEDPLRQGIAWYKAGDYAQAAAAFEQDSTAMGAYNLGLAYYQNGDYAAAEKAFGQAIDLDPNMKEADKNRQLARQNRAEIDPMSAEQAEEVPQEKQAENIENKDTEDLGGGGQEATEEDMQKERKEETVGTNMRTGKEMDEVPPDFESGKSENSQKVLMRKVDDDPALFLQRKFKHQVKTKNIKPTNKLEKW